MHESPTNTPDTPDTHYVRLMGKALFLMYAVVMVVMIVIGLWIATDPKTEAFLLVLAIFWGLAGLFGFLIFKGVRYRIKLTPDRIEIQDISSFRMLRLADIAYKREVVQGYGESRTVNVELTPKDASQKTMKFPARLCADKQLSAWLSAIPDQDLIDQQNWQLEQEANPLYGSTLQERRNFIDQQRKQFEIAKTVIWLPWIAIFLPKAYPLALVVVSAIPLGLIALSIRSKGLIPIMGSDVLWRMCVAALPLAIMGINADFLYLPQSSIGLTSFAVAVALSVCLGLLIVRIDRPRPTAKQWPIVLLLIGLWSYPYAFGLITGLNYLLDSRPAQTFQPELLWKKESKTSRGRKLWHFDIAPWGPVMGPTLNLDVSREFFEQTNLGDKVCIDLHEGALGIGWYRIYNCPASD
jgi:hypothetical protein